MNSLTLLLLSLLGSSAANSEPVMTIDGVPISEAEYEDWLVRHRGPVMFGDFARGELLLLEGERRGITVSAAEVEARVEKMASQRVRHAFGGSRASWVEELNTLGRTERGLWLERCIESRTALVAEQLLGASRNIPERTIVDTWELEYGVDGVRPILDLIHFTIPGSRRTKRAPEEVAAQENAARSRADAAYSRILAGEDFGELVRELSDDHESRLRGGLAPDDFSLGAWPPESTEAIRALEPGQISEPLQGPRGYWIVRLREWKTTPLEEVREQLVAELMEQPPGPEEIEILLSSLEGAGTIELLPAMHREPEAWGEWLPEDEIVIRSGNWDAERGTFADWLRHYRGEDWASRFQLHWIVKRKAASAEIVVTDEEVRARAAADKQTVIESNFEGDHGKWLRELQNSGRTEELYEIESRLRARDGLLAERLLIRDRVVTDGQIEGAWLEQYGDGGLTVYARMIVVRAEQPTLTPGMSEEEAQKLVDDSIEAARQLTLELRSRIEDGEDFASLAEQFSADEATSARGGALDGRFKQEEWPPEITTPVLATPVGGLTEPLRLGVAWLLFEVTESKVVELESIRDELRAELQKARPTEPELAAFRNVITRDVPVEILPGMYE